jgi:hypothetical protein
MLLYHGWPATIAYLPNFFSDLLYNSSVLYLLFISSGAVTLCVMAVIAFVIHRPLNRQFQNSVGLSRTGKASLLSQVIVSVLLSLAYYIVFAFVPAQMVIQSVGSLGQSASRSMSFATS